jgi:hypothetical protein
MYTFFCMCVGKLEKSGVFLLTGLLWNSYSYISHVLIKLR